MIHEIRTPLNAIIGFSDMMCQMGEEEEKQEYMKIVSSNNELLLQLIDDILDLSKIEAGTFDFCPSLIDVNQTMEEIEQSMRLRLKKETVTLTFIERLPECTLYTDKNRLIQLISNFVINAIKFTQTGSIRMGYRLKDADTICFYVSDTGCGMSEEQCKHVFERFVKYNPFVQGTGLGLSICQMIIDRLGGTIGVESEENKGSTFWFTLPVKPFDFLPLQQRTEDVSETVEFNETEYDAGAVRRTILIAEDMDDNYLLYKIYLEKHYHMIRATNREEAVSKYLECNPDIILMDIGMPVVDGYQATDAIRQLSSDIPIVAVTAFAYDEDRRKVMSRGFNGYLSKPLNKDELLKMLHKMGI